VIKYRREIDGLRAFAVVSVLTFHAGFSFVPGGFVGVDVFFVISGYLITSIIINELGVGAFSFSKFYERRVRRLLPPIVPVFLISWLFAFFLLGPEQFKDFSDSVYAALGFSSNWYFLSTVGYFDGPGEFTPFLHLWSLAIEEQFYFVFPAVLVFILRRNPSWLVVVSFCFAVLSFCGAAYFVSESQDDIAFYNSAVRFWEILVGSILASMSCSGDRNKLTADVMEVLGILMIVGPVLYYTDDIQFPGASALIPVIGSALIIAGNGQGRIVSPVLMSRVLVGIGLISYALYIWHWPVLVFLRIINPSGGVGVGLLGVGVSITLAIASYFYIESPVRRKFVLSSAREAYGFAIVFLLGMMIVVAAGKSQALAGYRADLLMQVRSFLYSGDRARIVSRIDDEARFYKEFLNLNFNGESGEYDQLKHDGWTCSFDQRNTPDKIFKCLVSQSKDHNVLVMGDSVGRDSWHALRRAYPKHNFIMLHQSGCPPGDFFRPGPENGCFRGSAELLGRLKSSIRVDAIVVSFRYRPREWKNVESGLVLAKTITDKVFMFGVSPMFGVRISDYIRSLPEGSSIPDFISEDNKRLTRWSYDSMTLEGRDLAGKYGIQFIDVGEFYCPNQKCRIWTFDNYYDPFMWDQSHLTNRGIEEFSGFLKGQSLLLEFLNKTSVGI